MKIYYLLLFTFITLLGCKKSIDIDAQYNSLKDNQTKFILTLDHKPFYEADAIFTGNLRLRDNFFAMNYFNQYGGNFMLTFDGKEWYNMKSIKGAGGSDFASLMAGKVIDAKNNKGVGYLLSNGNIEPISISKSKLVFGVSGRMKKYPKVNPDDPSYEFEGYIISKNPAFDEYAIPK